MHNRTATTTTTSVFAVHARQTAIVGSRSATWWRLYAEGCETAGSAGARAWNACAAYRRTEGRARLVVLSFSALSDALRRFCEESGAASAAPWSPPGCASPDAGRSLGAFVECLAATADGAYPSACESHAETLRSSIVAWLKSSSRTRDVERALHDAIASGAVPPLAHGDAVTLAFVEEDAPWHALWCECDDDCEPVADDALFADVASPAVAFGGSLAALSLLCDRAARATAVGGAASAFAARSHAKPRLVSFAGVTAIDAAADHGYALYRQRAQFASRCVPPRYHRDLLGPLCALLTPAVALAAARDARLVPRLGRNVAAVRVRLCDDGADYWLHVTARRRVDDGADPRAGLLSAILSHPVAAFAEDDAEIAACAPKLPALLLTTFSASLDGDGGAAGLVDARVATDDKRGGGRSDCLRFLLDASTASSAAPSTPWTMFGAARDASGVAWWSASIARENPIVEEEWGAWSALSETHRRVAAMWTRDGDTCRFSVKSRRVAERVRRRVAGAPAWPVQTAPLAFAERLSVPGWPSPAIVAAAHLSAHLSAPPPSRQPRRPLQPILVVAAQAPPVAALAAPAAVVEPPQRERVQVNIAITDARSSSRRDGRRGTRRARDVSTDDGAGDDVEDGDGDGDERDDRDGDDDDTASLDRDDGGDDADADAAERDAATMRPIGGVAAAPEAWLKTSAALPDDLRTRVLSALAATRDVESDRRVAREVGRIAEARARLDALLSERERARDRATDALVEMTRLADIRASVALPPPAASAPPALSAARREPRRRRVTFDDFVDVAVTTRDDATTARRAPPRRSNAASSSAKKRSDA